MPGDPLAAGRATLAASRAAFDRWAARADADLVVYLDAALGALQAGFSDDVLAAEPPARQGRHDRQARPDRQARQAARASLSDGAAAQLGPPTARVRDVDHRGHGVST